MIVKSSILFCLFGISHNEWLSGYCLDLSLSARLYIFLHFNLTYNFLKLDDPTRGMLFDKHIVFISNQFSFLYNYSKHFCSLQMLQHLKEILLQAIWLVKSCRNISYRMTLTSSPRASMLLSEFTVKFSLFPNRRNNTFFLLYKFLFFTRQTQSDGHIFCSHCSFCFIGLKAFWYIYLIFMPHRKWRLSYGYGCKSFVNALH